MAAPRDRVRFDEQGVTSIAGRVARSADDTDHECRHVLGNLEFGPRTAGEHYRNCGAVVEDGYRRVRRACDEWVATVNAHVDALRMAADRYTERDAMTADDMARVPGPDTLRGDPGRWSR